MAKGLLGAIRQRLDWNPSAGSEVSKPLEASADPLKPFAQWIKTSYSSEAEDLLIQRMLTVIKRPSDRPGYYLDVGGYHPIIENNTYLFYRQGWSGIVVEPNPTLCAEFAVHRPRDITLNNGLAAETGSLVYHQFGNAFLNGFLSQEWVDRHVQSGQQYLGSIEVACLGVRDFLQQHVHQPVDVLDIDIELADTAVLGAWDWQLCRPKVICAEIHAGGMESVLQSEIAGILRQADYTLMSRGWQSSCFVANEELRG